MYTFQLLPGRTRSCLPGGPGPGLLGRRGLRQRQAKVSPPMQDGGLRFDPEAALTLKSAKLDGGVLTGGVRAGGDVPLPAVAEVTRGRRAMPGRQGHRDRLRQFRRAARPADDLRAFHGLDQRAAGADVAGRQRHRAGGLQPPSTPTGTAPTPPSCMWRARGQGHRQGQRRHPLPPEDGRPAQRCLRPHLPDRLADVRGGPARRSPTPAGCTPRRRRAALAGELGPRGLRRRSSALGQRRAYGIES